MHGILYTDASTENQIVPRTSREKERAKERAKKCKKYFLPLSMLSIQVYIIKWIYVHVLMPLFFTFFFLLLLFRILLSNEVDELNLLQVLLLLWMFFLLLLLHEIALNCAWFHVMVKCVPWYDAHVFVRMKPKINNRITYEIG